MQKTAVFQDSRVTLFYQNIVLSTTSHLPRKIYGLALVLYQSIYWEKQKPVIFLYIGSSLKWLQELERDSRLLVKVIKLRWKQGFILNKKSNQIFHFDLTDRLHKTLENIFIFALIHVYI